MAEDVGTRAVRVGLATREQLAESLALSQRTGMPLVEALVCVGVPEDALEALFAAEGLGTKLDEGLPTDIGADVLPGFTGAMALAFLSLPLRREGEAVVVAMADPTDPHALAELAFRAGGAVLGRVARVGEIREAILSVFPDARASVGASTSSEEPRSLLESTVEAVPALRHVAPLDAPRGGAVPTVSDSSPPVAPRPISGIPPRADAGERTPHDSWGDLDAQTEPELPGAPSVRARETPSSPVRGRLERAQRNGGRLPEVGSFLAAMRAADDRDRALSLACEGALAVSRTAVFFALRRDTIRGHLARGVGLDDESVRLVEVPARSATVLGRVLADGRSYFGPYGTGAIDQMLRVSLGSRGGWVSVHTVDVEGKTVGLLLGDDVRHGPAGDERVGVLAHAAGQAMRRILSKSRRP